MTDYQQVLLGFLLGVSVWPYIRYRWHLRRERKYREQVQKRWDKWEKNQPWV